MLNKAESADPRSMSQVGMSCLGISIGQLLAQTENLAEEITFFQSEYFGINLKLHHIYNMLNFSLEMFCYIYYFQVPTLLIFILLYCSVGEASGTYNRFGLLQ